MPADKRLLIDACCVTWQWHTLWELSGKGEGRNSAQTTERLCERLLAGECSTWAPMDEQAQATISVPSLG